MSLRLCPTGKWGFFDAKTAWQRLCQIRKDPRAGCVPRRIYQCEHCGLWHLTSRANTHITK
jgi:hypothetical protein